MFVSYPMNPLLVRWSPFRPVLSFEHIQISPPDKTDRDARLMYGHYAAYTLQKSIARVSSVGWLYWGFTPLQQLRSYHGGRWRIRVSWLSHTSTNTTFLSNYFSHMLLQRCQAKIWRKEKSSQPGIEPGRVRHAHHWATRAGLSTDDCTLVCIVLSVKNYFSYDNYMRNVTWKLVLWHLSKTMSLWVPYGIFWKSCIVFCAKPKEVDPIKLNFRWHLSVSIALKYMINNGVLK